MYAAQLGHAHVLVRPLGRTNPLNLPFWIKLFPHIGPTISPCVLSSRFHALIGTQKEIDKYSFGNLIADLSDHLPIFAFLDLKDTNSFL